MEQKITTFEVSLPSKGLPYNGKIPAVLHLRLYTLQEEKLFADAKLHSSDNIITTALQAVIEEDIDVSMLTLGDREFLMVWERINSYGDEYRVALKCGSCKKESTQTINLSKLATKELPDNFQVPFVAKIGSFDVGLVLLTSKDDVLISEYVKTMKESEWLARYAQSIVSIDGREFKVLHDKVEFLKKNFTTKMFGFLRAFHSKFDHGKDFSIDFTCPHCGTEEKISMPFQLEFLLPTYDFDSDKREDISIDEVSEDESDGHTKS